MQEFSLEGRVAIVTGASSGIGRAIAELLGQRGADLALVARGQEKLEGAASELADATGLRCEAFAADVTDPEAVAALVQRVADRFGKIDIVVNNAGGTRHGALRDTDPAAWRGDIELNLNSAFYVARAAYPHLKGSGGCVVSVSSLAGDLGTIGTAGYPSAKAGLQMFTKMAAAEWGPSGIRVNAVAPGLIATAKARRTWEKTGFDAAKASTIFPLRRPGEPEEVAQAVAFLASDAASYISGEVLAVGGGPIMQGVIELD